MLVDSFENPTEDVVRGRVLGRSATAATAPGGSDRRETAPQEACAAVGESVEAGAEAALAADDGSGDSVDVGSRKLHEDADGGKKVEQKGFENE
jgi:hypothetical protein